MIPLLLFAGGATAAYLAYAAGRGAAQLLNPASQQLLEDPTDYGLAVSDVRLTRPAGPALAAWYVAAAQPTDRAIALFHGHSTSRSQLLKYARFLQPRFNCLLVDFRACGDSEGRHSSMGYLEAEDVKVAIAWLEAQGQTHIGAFGMSMGGAAVLRAAPDLPAIRSVVTDGTFARVAHVIAQRATVKGYPFPELVALATLAEVRRRLGVRLSTDEPVEAIRRLERPVLLIQGVDDATCQMSNAERLFAAAGPAAELWLVPAAGHTLAWKVAREAYEARVSAFYEKTLLC